MFGLVNQLGIDRLFADQNGHAGALGFIILTGDIQDIGANNRTGFLSGSPSGDWHYRSSVDIGDVAVALFCRFGVTDIVDTKTQAFGQVVKAVQLQFFQFSSPPYFASRCGQSIMQILW
ncbi:hypothetical protein LNQ03_11920 [Klebsiella pneumoniae subsp. pneumoniae]|nr:hypothetical protein [Klebsiella pneumoniae subsp. pneumoniae]